MASFITHPHFNEGEGIDPSDFTELAQCLRAQMWDYIAMQLYRGDGEENPAFNGTFPVMIGNGGHLTISVTPLTVSLHDKGGVVLLPGGGAAALNGVEPRFVPYAFDSTYTHNLTFAPDTGVGDRWDIIQCKHDYFQVATPAAGNDQESRDKEDASVEPHIYTTTSFPKRKNVVGTYSIKQGTPGAGEPAVDAGYKKMYAVRIPDGSSGSYTFVSTTDIRDYRIPIGIARQRVTAVNGGFALANWTRTGGVLSSLVADGAGVRELTLIPLGGSPHMSGRLVRIGLQGTFVAGSTATALLVRVNQGFTAATTVATLTSDLITAGGGSLYRYKSMQSTAMWMNGYEAGSTVAAGSPANTNTTLALLVQTGATHADRVDYVDFDVAGV